MNKLEQLHFENGLNDIEYVSNAAKITEDIAIKFAEWCMCLDNGTTFYNPFTEEK